MTKHSPLDDRLGDGERDPLSDRLNFRLLEQLKKTLSMFGRLVDIATADNARHLLVPLAQVKTLLVVRNRGLEARLVPEDPLRKSSRGCGIRPILPHMSVPLKVASLPPRILVLGEIRHASRPKRRRLRMPIGVLERGIKLLRRVARRLETLQTKSACLHCIPMGKSTFPVPPHTYSASASNQGALSASGIPSSSITVFALASFNSGRSFSWAISASWV